MASSCEVTGKTFLITGAASGLGALNAKTFLKNGAKKVAILDVAEEVGKATAAQLNGVYPGKVTFIKCDVSDEKSITEAFNAVLNDFKQIDVIINNAGIMSDAPDAWRKACDVNWQGLVSMTMKGLKHMRKDEGGSGGTIINISSTAALNKLRQLPIYCGSKMAVLHFSQSLAVEPFHEQTGVRILTMCFGPTATALLQGLKSRAYDEKTGEELVIMNKISTATHKHQKPESAIAAVLKMFTTGANGTIWLSVYDKPAQDITPVIEGIFKEFEKLTFPTID